MTLEELKEEANEKIRQVVYEQELKPVIMSIFANKIKELCQDIINKAYESGQLSTVDYEN